MLINEAIIKFKFGLPKITKELDDFIYATTGAKHYQPRCPLKTLYGLFNKFNKKPRLHYID